MLTQLINARILTPQGWLKDGSVLIRDGKILEVSDEIFLCIVQRNKSFSLHNSIIICKFAAD